MNKLPTRKLTDLKKDKKEVYKYHNSNYSEIQCCNFAKSEFTNIIYTKHTNNEAKNMSFSGNEYDYFYLAENKKHFRENKKVIKKYQKKNKTCNINININASDNIGNFEIVQYLSNYRLQSLMFEKWKKIFNNHLIKSICDNSYGTSIINPQEKQLHSQETNKKSIIPSDSVNYDKNLIHNTTNNYTNDFNLYIPDNIHDFVNLPDLLLFAENSDQTMNSQSCIETKQCSSKVKINANLEDEMDNIIDSMFSEN